jgi:hypothetical protein
MDYRKQGIIAGVRRKIRKGYFRTNPPRSMVSLSGVPVQFSLVVDDFFGVKYIGRGTQITPGGYQSTMR